MKNKSIFPKFNKILIGAGVKDKYIRPLLELCNAANLPIEIASFDTSGSYNQFPIKNPYHKDVKKKILEKIGDIKDGARLGAICWDVVREKEGRSEGLDSGAELGSP